MEDQSKDIWNFKPYTILETKGIKIAFFGISQFMNKHLAQPQKSNDTYRQVYMLGGDTWFLKFKAKNIPKLLKWIKEAKDVDGADVIIIYIHWGLKYGEKGDHYPDIFQIKWGKKLLESGVDIIVGGHIHTLQHGKKYITKSGKETFISYSLGNFLNDYTNPNKAAAAILYITLVKNEKGIFIKKIKYLPTYYLMKKEGEEIIDLQVVPLDKYEHLSHFNNHFKNIFGKHNLVTSEEIEKEYNLS
jgi:poly-gamma-glutamate synthesis protein (capsule biosynthesis protein)